MEEKKYKVTDITIGTDEYRDLITKVVSTETELSELKSKYYRLDVDVSNYRKKADEAKKELEMIYHFLYESGNIEKFRKWKEADI